jgi:hypothetical protein
MKFLIIDLKKFQKKITTNPRDKLLDLRVISISFQTKKITRKKHSSKKEIKRQLEQ